MTSRICLLWAVAAVLLPATAWAQRSRTYRKSPSAARPVHRTTTRSATRAVRFGGSHPVIVHESGCGCEAPAPHCGCSVCNPCCPPPLLPRLLKGLDDALHCMFPCSRCCDSGCGAPSYWGPQCGCDHHGPVIHTEPALPKPDADQAPDRNADRVLRRRTTIRTPRYRYPVGTSQRTPRSRYGRPTPARTPRTVRKPTPVRTTSLERTVRPVNYEEPRKLAEPRRLSPAPASRSSDAVPVRPRPLPSKVRNPLRD